MSPLTLLILAVCLVCHTSALNVHSTQATVQAKFTPAVVDDLDVTTTQLTKEDVDALLLQIPTDEKLRQADRAALTDFLGHFNDTEMGIAADEFVELHPKLKNEDTIELATHLLTRIAEAYGSHPDEFFGPEGSHRRRFRGLVVLVCALRVLEYNAIAKPANGNLKLALNKFAFVDKDEMEQFQGLIPENGAPATLDAASASDDTPKSPNPFATSAESLPSSVDLRHEGLVGPVKNQGSCGSCWSFAAMGALEGLMAAENGALFSLSEQQVLSCFIPNTYGCNGGTYSAVWGSYADAQPVTSETNYPYEAKVDTCLVNKENEGIVQDGGYKWLGRGGSLRASDNDMMAAVVKQPVAVSIGASDRCFQSYSSGIISTKSCDCSAQVDHAVLLVGYGTQDGMNYWLVKNSWGTGWGEDGYVKIERNEAANNGYGVCGINTQPGIPILSSYSSTCSANSTAMTLCNNNALVRYGYAENGTCIEDESGAYTKSDCTITKTNDDGLPTWAWVLIGILIGIAVLCLGWIVYAVFFRKKQADNNNYARMDDEEQQA